MTAEAGTVCAVKQSSLGMESQPAGVEQAGVVQPPEVAGAPVERGQDEAGNGRQGEQQQHLRALRRIWGAREGAREQLDEKTVRASSLVSAGSWSKSSSLSSHLGGGDMKADEKGTMGTTFGGGRWRRLSAVFQRNRMGAHGRCGATAEKKWIIPVDNWDHDNSRIFWKSSSACKADLRRSLIFASFKEVDLAAMSEGSHHRDDHRFLQTPRKSQLTLLQRRRPAKTCCAYVSIPGLSQVPVSQISVSSLPFPGSVSPHPSPPSSSRHSLHPGSRQSRAWAALHVSGGRHRFWSPVTTSGLRGPFTIVFSLEREERHNKAPDLARVKPWQWPGRGPSSRSNEAHPSVLRARAWACGTRERSGQKLSAIVNDSNPYLMCARARANPIRCWRERESPFRRAFEARGERMHWQERIRRTPSVSQLRRGRGWRSRGIQSRRHMRVEGVRVMGKVMVMGTSRSKGVSEREIVGSKCLPNRCPARERPSDVWDEGGFNGVRVHVVFERWLEDFLSVRERTEGGEKETERRRDGESLGETERALERILGKILGVTQITDEFSISDSHSEIY
ncbi:hypothetical protein BJV77DRAFT_1088823 [Russula vinacea]|nr:hypothetical protein BJV77DRAFT_1088823 [Russula vinacea]